MARFKTPKGLRVKVRNEWWISPGTDVEVMDPDVIAALRLNKMTTEVVAGSPEAKPEAKPEAEKPKRKRK